MCGLSALFVVPSQPSEFKGEAKSETNILLSWVAPPQGGPDNQITGYELVYRRADDTEEVRMKEGGASFCWDSKWMYGQMDDNRLKNRCGTGWMVEQRKDELTSILKWNEGSTPRSQPFSFPSQTDVSHCPVPLRRKWALSRPPPTCWRTWSLSPPTPSSWLPGASMESGRTPTRCPSKRRRHVGVTAHTAVCECVSVWVRMRKTESFQLWQCKHENWHKNWTTYLLM